MSRSKPSAWYALDGEPAIGIVRCKPDDVAEFERLAADLLQCLGEDPAEYRIGAPVWRWYRHNPCTDGEHTWDLGKANGPGPGNWTGAYVVPASQAAEMERIERIMRHEAVAR